MELIRHFPANTLAAALAEWAWLPDLDGKTTLIASAFGDLFLQGSDGVWFLDTIEGTLTREWPHAAALQDALSTLEGQDRFLLLGLVQAAQDAGIEPAADQVLSFKQPPILGGLFEVANLQAADLGPTLAAGGQLHGELTSRKQAPPATPSDD